MRILFVVSRIPFNIHSGDRIRVYYFIKKLVERGHNVDLIGFKAEGDIDSRTDIKKICNRIVAVEKKDIDFEHPNRFSQLIKFLESFYYGYPFRVWQWHHTELKKKAADLLNNQNYDVIHFSDIAMGSTFNHLKSQKTDALFVYDLYDSIAMALERSIRNKTSLLSPFRLLEWIRLKKFEKHVARRADRTIFIAERDKKYVGRDDAFIIPNGVANGSHKNPERDIDLLFVGNLSTEPNVDAAKFLSHHILPKLLKNNPRITLYLVGAVPQPEIKKMAGKNIKVTGFVDNIDDYYRRAKLFVCPMRLGSGQKNKILQAMVNKAPVICTGEANIGINAPDDAIKIANTPREFVNAINQLSHDKQQRTQLAENGYHFVKSNYSWSRSTDLLEECYKR